MDFNWNGLDTKAQLQFVAHLLEVFISKFFYFTHSNNNLVDKNHKTKFLNEIYSISVFISFGLPIN